MRSRELTETSKLPVSTYVTNLTTQNESNYDFHFLIWVLLGQADEEEVL